MKKLLEFTGFPSIEDLANQDAFSLIKQWQIFKPDMFTKNKALVESKSIIWSDVKPYYNESSLCKWLVMAKKHEKFNKNKTYPEFFKISDSIKSRLEKNNNFTFKMWNKLNSISSMEYFSCLEPYDIVDRYRCVFNFDGFEDTDGIFHPYTHEVTADNNIVPITFQINDFSVISPIFTPADTNEVPIGNIKSRICLVGDAR